MTISSEKPTIVRSMPGWDIAADLTPPELINARQLKVLRKLITAGIATLLLVCVGGFYVAARENSSASSELAAVQDRTLQLEGIGRGYHDVVSIQGEVGEARTQIAGLMSGDVDVAALMGELRSKLPATMTITEETITISPAGVAVADSNSAAGGLDVSGLPRIGTISVNGTGQTLDDLSNYVDNLHAVNGLVDVLPVANTVSATTGTEFTLTMGLTNALLSHRFDVGG